MVNMKNIDHEGLLAASEPRYLQLARTLAQQIRSRQRVVGELLPTEAELCAEWNLSRYSVRQAIQKLGALGLISRQAGVGTRIISDQPQTRYTQSMDTLSDLAKYAEGTTMHITQQTYVRTDRELAALAHCPVDQDWLHIAGIRYRGEDLDEPIALVDMYIDGKYSQLSDLSKPLDRPLYALIESTYGIKVTRVEQEIQGILIEGEKAHALQVPDGCAGLRILRTYFVQDAVVEVTSGIHPASRFSYSMTFQLVPRTS